MSKGSSPAELEALLLDEWKNGRGGEIRTHDLLYPKQFLGYLLGCSYLGFVARHCAYITQVVSANPGKCKRFSQLRITRPKKMFGDLWGQAHGLGNLWGGRKRAEPLGNVWGVPAGVKKRSPQGTAFRMRLPWPRGGSAAATGGISKRASGRWWRRNWPICPRVGRKKTVQICTVIPSRFNRRLIF